MDKRIKVVYEELTKTGRLAEERKYCHHGDTSVLRHSMQVANLSLKIVDKLKLRVNERSLLRGALLHDYFLYDWHEKDKSHRLHGFRHPSFALKNAKEDYKLNETEENIILRHMFPLVPIPPTCTEAWIVCFADKYCALNETMIPRILLVTYLAGKIFIKIKRKVAQKK